MWQLTLPVKKIVLWYHGAPLLWLKHTASSPWVKMGTIAHATLPQPTAHCPSSSVSSDIQFLSQPAMRTAPVRPALMSQSPQVFVLCKAHICELNPQPSLTAWYLIEPLMIFSTHRPLPAWWSISEIPLQQPVCAVVMGTQKECCKILWLCTEWKWKQVALSQPNYHLHNPGSRLWNSL